MYETLLTCKFDILRNELPVIAGVEPQSWKVAFTALISSPLITRIAGG